MTQTASVDESQLIGEIPTFNLSDFDKNPDAFAQEIGAGIEEFGFCGLQDHGLPEKLVEDAYAVMRDFFALPEETKLQYTDPDIGPQRGYVPFGKEKAKDSTTFDLKEMWHVGRSLTEDERSSIPSQFRLHKNFWPTEIPDFKPVMSGLYNTLDQISLKVLRALALYLKQDIDFFDKRTGKDDSLLRALHYPPIDDLETEAMRAGAHEDINLITLLVGSNEPGLEILDKKGRWIPVTTIPGTIVCNIGDMLQRFTNNVLPSRTHQVVNPPGENRLQPRFSIPFFKHMNGETIIEPLESCITAENPCQFEPITEYQYLMQRLIELHVIPCDDIESFGLPLHALKEIKNNFITSQKPVPKALETAINKAL